MKTILSLFLIFSVPSASAGWFGKKYADFFQMQLGMDESAFKAHKIFSSCKSQEMSEAEKPITLAYFCSGFSDSTISEVGTSFYKSKLVVMQFFFKEANVPYGSLAGYSGVLGKLGHPSIERAFNPGEAPDKVSIDCIDNNCRTGKWEDGKDSSALMISMPLVRGNSVLYLRIIDEAEVQNWISAVKAAKAVFNKKSAGSLGY